MTVKEALELLVFQELNCDNMSECSDCPIHQAIGEPCWGLCHSAAELIEEWLNKLTEDALPNITIADLL